MEEFIFVLLVFIWIIASAVRGTKSKKPPTATPKSKPVILADWDEITEELKPFDTRTKPRSATPADFGTGTSYRAPKPSISENYKAFGGTFATTFGGEDYFSLDAIEDDSAMHYAMTTGEIGSEEEQESDKSFEDFNLRDAIIFEAVLNRPFEY